MKMIIVLLMSALFTGCIKDDYNGCPVDTDVVVDPWGEDGQNKNN